MLATSEARSTIVDRTKINYCRGLRLQKQRVEEVAAYDILGSPIINDNISWLCMQRGNNQASSTDDSFGLFWNFPLCLVHFGSQDLSAKRFLASFLRFSKMPISENDEEPDRRWDCPFAVRGPFQIFSVTFNYLITAALLQSNP